MFGNLNTGSMRLVDVDGKCSILKLKECCYLELKCDYVNGICYRNMFIYIMLMMDFYLKALQI